MKLTSKQQKFADEFLETGNIEQSAITAGYSKAYARGNAHKLVANVSIKSYIEERMAEIKSKRIMGIEEAVEILTSIARGEMKETVVVGTPIGAETIEKEADLKTRISALKEIMKRYPDNDKLVEQQIRKLSAEADISEARAKELMSDGYVDDVQIIGFDRRKANAERSEDS
ncbi:prophage Lp2 protein 34 [Leuconostoc kimchii IMSNU 11154]|uniref:Prophage Lp2 protein 34 n=1 Tax=Leuconostoc kimchii (strain IMSNU 11154 / KCTC 2386 / IH25) TaxID=762051 RepID=D5T4K0_LEUKI|nr:terminase small subunit [Leuconostoc kimchii]ADG41471.1 prophage Lp2 protein 34 [Leuconostoc kimchii IMSNU 11154]